MSPEELHKLQLQRENLLVMMRASAFEVHETVRRTLTVIEQTRIILRELDDRHW